jgi:DNA-directed RNA polymerase subunit RPC12/RpoP
VNYEIAKASYACTECQSPQEIVHTLSLTSSGVKSSSSFKCTNCGSAFEADDRGVPEDLRPVFYAANGRWELRFIDAGPRKIETLRLLHNLLRLSLAEIAGLVRQTPSAIAEGTNVEMQYLAREIGLSGAKVEVAPAPKR